MHWTHEQIMEMAEAAVFTRWLAGGGPQTIAEIASEIGVSESTLRRHSDQHAGAPRGCKVEHVERARSGMTGAGYYRATCWVPSEAGLRARFVAMVERLREATEGSPRDRAEMEARG